MSAMPKRIAGCTLQKAGYYRWYEGRTRFVCSGKTPADAVEDRWYELKKLIDQGLTRRPPSLATVRELVSDFIDAMERRVATGKPKRLSPRMLANYVADLNEFGLAVGGGVRAADVGPRHFDIYVAAIAHMKRSGYDSKVAHVRTLFQWAVKNEYIDAARYGSSFERPSKQDIRDERIVAPMSFTPGEVALLIDRAGPTMRLMLMLGVCAAMNNSEIAWLDRVCVDMEAGVLDFRRRKTGRVRRVVPLPPDVADELRAYRRPAPKDPAHADLFFLTEDGNPYVRMRDTSQANTITVLFRRLAAECGVKDLAKGKSDGRGFKGLRTTCTNLAPPGYREEVEIITGHARGTVLLDHYLETFKLERLRHVVVHVWAQVSIERAGSASSSGPDGRPDVGVAPAAGTASPAQPQTQPHPV